LLKIKEKRLGNKIANAERNGLQAGTGGLGRHDYPNAQGLQHKRPATR
jgi:hypothetical protein